MRLHDLGRAGEGRLPGPATMFKKAGKALKLQLGDHQLPVSPFPRPARLSERKPTAESAAGGDKHETAEGDRRAGWKTAVKKAAAKSLAKKMRRKRHLNLRPKPPRRPRPRPQRKKKHHVKTKKSAEED